MTKVSSIGGGLRLLLLIAMVAAVPSAALAQACGNRTTESDEECDDGNTDGGDGCASNCTEESRRPCYFTDATLIYQDLLPQVTPLRGVQILTLGAARASDPSGEIPFVVRTDDLSFENQESPRIGACSCVKGSPDSALGPAIVARGRIGCGAGLAPVNYTTTMDHNTHLADPDPDPQCLTGTVEGAVQPHPGACNGRSQTNADVDGPTGSVVATYSLTNYLLTDRADCSSGGPGSPDRPQGADGEACTPDDPQWSPSLLSATTGRVTTRLLHARNEGPVEPRELSVSGTTVSCSALTQGEPDRALEGMVLVASANTLLDTSELDDFIGTFRFVCSGAPPTATPTATFLPDVATSTPTPTVTATVPTTGGTPTATSTRPVTSTPTSSGSPACGGDCDGNRQVRVDELVRGVNIALDRAPLDTCPSFDGNSDGFLRINELVAGVNNLLRGCSE